MILNNIRTISSNFTNNFIYLLVTDKNSSGNQYIILFILKFKKFITKNRKMKNNKKKLQEM